MTGFLLLARVLLRRRTGIRTTRGTLTRCLPSVRRRGRRTVEQIARRIESANRRPSLFQPAPERRNTPCSRNSTGPSLKPADVQNDISAPETSSTRRPVRRDDREARAQASLACNRDSTRRGVAQPDTAARSARSGTLPLPAMTRHAGEHACRARCAATRRAGRSCPAENSAYLGRSLFTDYLLPVELGGTLLLVATVGAIAIADAGSGPRRAGQRGGSHDRVPLHHYLVVGAILFVLGMIGFLPRRNLIVMFLSPEMMLQGVAINLVAFARYRGNLHGQVFDAVHPDRGGLRGGHRPGADPDALPPQGLARRQPLAGAARAGQEPTDSTRSRCPSRRRAEPHAAPDPAGNEPADARGERAMSEACAPTSG